MLISLQTYYLLAIALPAASALRNSPPKSQDLFERLLCDLVLNELHLCALKM